MDRYPYRWYTILLEATRALAHIGIHFTHRVFGLLEPQPGATTPALVVRPEKFQFLEKGQNRNFGYKILISVKNPKFILWISDDEMDFTVGIVSRHLASTSNFVEIPR